MLQFQKTYWRAILIKIQPFIDYIPSCPYCGVDLKSKKILWQGIHVVVISRCLSCQVEIVSDLPIGQALFTPYQVNKATNKIFGAKSALAWFGKPLLESLQKPEKDLPVVMKIEKRRVVKNAVILNCIDYLYGHSLLKLLNSDSYKDLDEHTGLIVIVPRFLSWMVPKYVAEIWVVDILLSKSNNYYTKLHSQIEQQLTRFSTVHISLAHSHPSNFEISNFTGVKVRKMKGPPFHVTFIWREDRIWERRWLGMILKILKLNLLWQNYKVTKMFKSLRKTLPSITFSVLGLGRRTVFPDWINDKRVDVFDDKSERSTCLLYSKSDLVIGVHGSNMLLPSAHAWAVIDLMPNDRWLNMAQDLLYQAKGVDHRMLSWRYRFLPLATSIKDVCLVASSLLTHAETTSDQFEQKIPENL